MNDLTEPTSISAIQLFDLKGLRNWIGAFKDSTPQEVSEVFLSKGEQVDEFLSQGFTSWIDPNENGISRVETILVPRAKFSIKRMIINGLPVSLEIYGKYIIGKNKLSINVDGETGAPLISCNVFLNHALVARQLSPFDAPQAFAKDFLANLHKEKGSDPNTYKSDRESPLPLALRMLRDFSLSVFDEKSTIDNFKRNPENHIRKIWNKEYRLK